SDWPPGTTATSTCWARCRWPTWSPSSSACRSSPSPGGWSSPAVNRGPPACDDLWVNEDLPLDGVRVIEIAGGIAAAFATRLMAGFGAEVTRIEGLGEGPALSEAEEVYLVAG